jgi:hypothetical protein
MKLGLRRWLLLLTLVLMGMFVCLGSATAQSKAAAGKEVNSPPVSTLEHDFFDAIRDGDTQKFLSYVPEREINVGPQAQPTSRAEVQQQLLAHHGLYCKLFDSSCIDTPIKLDASSRACSYRELLNHSKSVHTAATQTTRNGVQQAILVARIENDQCPGDKLIDFIFNLEAGGWKLFSLP